jgi:hypothetical protein
MEESIAKDSDITLCSEKAGYCNEKKIEDDYNLEAEEELHYEL